MHFNIQFQPPLNRYQVVALREVLFIKYLLPKTLHFLLKGEGSKHVVCGSCPINIEFVHVME